VEHRQLKPFPPGAETGVLGRRDRAAMGALKQPSFMQKLQVATDGCAGDREQLGQVLHIYDARFRKMIKNPSMAINFEHAGHPTAMHKCAQTLSIFAQSC
jgi:hypothetical protein